MFFLFIFLLFYFLWTIAERKNILWTWMWMKHFYHLDFRHIFFSKISYKTSNFYTCFLDMIFLVASKSLVENGCITLSISKGQRINVMSLIFLSNGKKFLKCFKMFRYITQQHNIHRNDFTKHISAIE